MITNNMQYLKNACIHTYHTYMHACLQTEKKHAYIQTDRRACIHTDRQAGRHTIHTYVRTYVHTWLYVIVLRTHVGLSMSCRWGCLWAATRLPWISKRLPCHSVARAAAVACRPCAVSFALTNGNKWRTSSAVPRMGFCFKLCSK